MSAPTKHTAFTAFNAQTKLEPTEIWNIEKENSYLAPDVCMLKCMCC